MEHNDAQLGERDSSAIRGTGGHMTVGSLAQNLFHTGLSCVEQCTFVPLYSGLSCFEVVEVVPWSLSHWLEWWCDVECEVEEVMCQPELAAQPSHAN